MLAGCSCGLSTCYSSSRSSVCTASQHSAHGLIRRASLNNLPSVRLPNWWPGYQQLLYRSAFGNFRQLLYDMTLNPAMGRFLNMLNNRCQMRTPPEVDICRNGLSSKPNENYAREILQLFSIGTFLLHQNGTRQLDGSGNPIATYDQLTVEEFARVLTGWILAPALAGPADIGGTVPNYRDPMRA